jgi:hypothetical protein
MAYRFTNTEKWDDAWFSDLKPAFKLLYLYLCDKCDIAGFLEINIRKIAYDLGISKQDVEGGLLAIDSRLIFSIDKKYLFIRNFLKHQKYLQLNKEGRWSLNENTTTYKKIIECINEKLEYFNFQSINDFFNTLSIPYTYPIGIGNGIGNGKKEEKNKDNPLDARAETPTWREDFEIYKTELRNAYSLLINDEEFIKEREQYHPKLDIVKSLEKSCVDFWATEAGWIHKKKEKSLTIDWKKTLKNALNQKSNKVWNYDN